MRAIIWDIGGVLVRTEDRQPRTLLAQRLGITYEELEQRVFNGEHGREAQLGLVNASMYWQQVCARFGLDPERVMDFRSAFFGGDFLDENLMEYIRALHKRYRTGVISNAFNDVRRIAETEWKMADTFDDMVISAEVGVMKPDERIFRIALHRLGISPQEAVFIDDVLANVQGAQAVGMYAIHFRSAAQAREDLETILGSAA